MKKLQTFAVAIGHGKIGSWNNHVSTFSIDLITQVTKYYTIFGFLAPSSPTCKLSQHWPESTTLGDQIDTNKNQLHEIFGTSKPPKACTCINFPHTFLMAQIGGMIKTLISLDKIADSQWDLKRAWNSNSNEVHWKEIKLKFSTSF